MDLIAALALVLVFEGLALAIFARSVPEVLASLDQVGPQGLRRAGIVAIVLGMTGYLLVRGG